MLDSINSKWSFVEISWRSWSGWFVKPWTESKRTWGDEEEGTHFDCTWEEFYRLLQRMAPSQAGKFIISLANSVSYLKIFLTKLSLSKDLYFSYCLCHKFMLGKFYCKTIFKHSSITVHLLTYVLQFVCKFLPVPMCWRTAPCTRPSWSTLTGRGCASKQRRKRTRRPCRRSSWSSATSLRK